MSDVHYQPLGKACDVLRCGREAVLDDGEMILCERHAPDPSVRSWQEMKAEGIEIETMTEYQNEVRGFNDYDPPEPDDYDPDYWWED